MGITLYLGCWMGGSIGFYFIMGVTLYLGCLLEGFYCIFGFHVGFGCCGYVVSYGFFMWAS
jgi:hypothetical protein